MNILDAIDAHRAWRRRFRRMLTGDEPAPPSDWIWHDNRCELGAWMYRDGWKYVSCTSFAMSYAAHIEFHRCASAVLRAFEEGDRVRAEALMASGSAFDRASLAIEWHLRRLAGELPKVASVSVG